MVVKVGGVALEDSGRRWRLAEDLVLLHLAGVRVVLVHGGGKQISEMLGRLGIAPKFVDGIRVTDEQVLEVASMVLGGSINQELVKNISLVGGHAVGLTGKDGGLAVAEKTEVEALGFVGQIKAMEVSILMPLMERFVPVIAPISADASGQTLNVNADVFAAELAVAMKAEKLMLLSDVEGVLDNSGSRISSLSVQRAQALINDGVANGGMVPKLRNAMSAIQRGVTKVHIVDGRVEHSLLLEVFTSEGIGTEIVAE